MKSLLSLILIIIMAALCIGCGSAQSLATAAPEPERISEAAPNEGEEAAQAGSTESEGAETMHMKIGETELEVAWEDNESVAALRELARDGLSIGMNMYGGFEQVGPIGESLPRADKQTTTQAGDIVLYAGNQLVVFYGSNSWAYTRLGHITDKSAQELEELLGSGDITITLTLT